MKTKASIISVNFQGQSVQIGTTLFSFEDNRFVKITGMQEIADSIYITFKNYDSTEICVPLCSSAFSVLPTQKKANEEFDLLQKYKSANKPHEVFKLYQGWIHNQEKANLIAEHTKEGIIRHIAKYTNFALPYFIKEVQYGATTSKNTLNVCTFVKLYFREMSNNRKNEQARTMQGINTNKAIRFLLKKEFLQENANQNQEFKDWLIEKDLT